MQTIIKKEILEYQERINYELIDSTEYCVTVVENTVTDNTGETIEFKQDFGIKVYSDERKVFEAPDETIFLVTKNFLKDLREVDITESYHTIIHKEGENKLNAYKDYLNGNKKNYSILKQVELNNYFNISLLQDVQTGEYHYNKIPIQTPNCNEETCNLKELVQYLHNRQDIAFKTHISTEKFSIDREVTKEGMDLILTDGGLYYKESNNINRKKLIPHCILWYPSKEDIQKVIEFNNKSNHNIETEKAWQDSNDGYDYIFNKLLNCDQFKLNIKKPKNKFN